MSNLISLLLILASFGVLFGYVQPTYGDATGSAVLTEQSIVELKETMAGYADALNKTKEIEKERTGLLQKYNEIPLADRSRLEKLLPDHIDSVRLIIDINTIAAQYGMTLRNIGLTDGKSVSSKASGSTIGPKDDKVKGVELKFSVSGAYNEFRSFMKDLEQSLRLVDVESVNFSAGDEDTYTYTLSIVTYRLNL
ncbi:MAG: type 4a pilus biogenesis protein PilO [bacterium]|nr:type 4a pilus biogenesis protein PilO [bacterium]